MKIKFLMTGLIGLMSISAFAQKGELNSAKDNYESYVIARANRLTMPQATKDLTDAKTSIDKASVNEKTAGLPLTFAVKGAVYSGLALQDSVPATSLPNFKIADEALTKAKALDSVKQDKDVEKIIKDAYANLGKYEFDMGRTQYANKKYDQAYQSFNYYHNIQPEDTLGLYVTALSATMAGTNDPKYNTYAINAYNKLLATDYKEKIDAYNTLSAVYLANKDTTDALRISAEAVEKYPDNNQLRNREIVIGLQSHRQEEVIDKIDKAIAKDPKNKTLYYYEGATYVQIAQHYDNQAKKAKDAATKTSLSQKEIDNYAKAIDVLKRGLELDPNYFEINLNLGLANLNTGAVESFQANQLPANKQKEYEAANAKAKAQLDLAKPYLLKAVEINPKSEDALDYLKTYYLDKNDTADANEVQKKIEALGK